MIESNGKIKVGIGMLTVSILLMLQIIGFSFGYGLLTQQVEFNRELIERYQDGQADVLNKIDELSYRIVQLELILSHYTDDD